MPPHDLPKQTFLLTITEESKIITSNIIMSTISNVLGFVDNKKIFKFPLSRV